MVGILLGRQTAGDDVGKAQAEPVNWLPRSRLRSGGRRDFLMTSLMVATVSLIAAAAGFAAWSRHGDDPAAFASAIQKPPERVSVARAPVFPAAPTAPSAPAAAPVRNVSAAPTAPPPPSEPRAAGQLATAPSSTVISTDSTGAPIARASTPAQAARIKPRSETMPQPVSPPRPVAAAPLTNFSAGSFEVLPPLAGVADWAPRPVPSAPATPPAAPPSSPSRTDPAAPRDLSSAARSGQAPPAASQAASQAATSPSPPPQRTAALSQPVPAGAKVSVYLDQYPDQKAAAAALSQKSGAYGKAIGSAGKLTYTRRNGDSWRLRVSNLDQSAAEAMCVRLRSAGAPCSIGPN